MSSRQRALIVALCVSAIAVVGTAIWALTYDSGSSSKHSAAGTASKAGASTTRASTTGGPSTTSHATSGATTTALDPSRLQSEITSFLSRFATALRGGDPTFLFDHLHPAVIRAYGPDTCLESVKRAIDSTADYKLIDIQRTGSFSWNSGTRTIEIPNTITATVEVVSHGVGSRVDLHLVWSNNRINYFRNCTQ